MSKKLFDKTQSLLRGYGDQVSVRALILEVKKPVKQFPSGVDGVLFLPYVPTLIAFCRTKEHRDQWLEWEHRDQVVDIYGFPETRAFGLKVLPGGQIVSADYSSRPPTLIEQLGPEFERDLRSMESHRVLAAKWNVKHSAISYQRRKLGVSLQSDRRNNGLTAYLQ